MTFWLGESLRYFDHMDSTISWEEGNVLAQV